MQHAGSTGAAAIMAAVLAAAISATPASAFLPGGTGGGKKCQPKTFRGAPDRTLRGVRIRTLLDHRKRKHFNSCSVWGGVRLTNNSGTVRYVHMFRCWSRQGRQRGTFTNHYHGWTRLPPGATLTWIIPGGLGSSSGHRQMKCAIGVAPFDPRPARCVGRKLQSMTSCTSPANQKYFAWQKRQKAATPTTKTNTATTTGRLAPFLGYSCGAAGSTGLGETGSGPRPAVTKSSATSSA